MLIFNDVDQYRHNTLIKFGNDLDLYDIPFGFRMYKGIDLYVIAQEQLYFYRIGTLTLTDIFLNPDNELRNIIKLWPIDKKKLSLKTERCLQNVNE